MAKETLLDKAKKDLGAKLEEAFSAHALVFGPIMEGVFAQDETAKIHFVAALNKLSRREAADGMKLLEKQVSKRCVTDAEKGAYHFFTALGMEYLGERASAWEHYAAAADLCRPFYMIHAKLARLAHADARFELAAKAYENEIAVLRAFPNEPKGQHSQILASAYSNLGSCLTMMHRYDEAEEALLRSSEVLPEMYERESALAILFAARGDRSVSEAHLENVRKRAHPFVYESAKTMTMAILDGKDAHFAALPVSEAEIDRFWKWFLTSKAVKKAIESKDLDELLLASEKISDRLQSVFPFMKRELSVRPAVDGGVTFFFADYFAKSLSFGYAALFARCPEEIKTRVELIIIHG